MSATAHSLADMAHALNRPAVVLTSLQHRFELPAFSGPDYANAYLEFLRTLLSLRALAISEDRILELWHLEKKLLQLIHVDSTGSKTWFLDYCGRTDISAELPHLRQTAKWAARLSRSPHQQSNP